MPICSTFFWLYNRFDYRYIVRAQDRAKTMFGVRFGVLAGAATPLQKSLFQARMDSIPTKKNRLQGPRKTCLARHRHFFGRMHVPSRKMRLGFAASSTPRVVLLRCSRERPPSSSLPISRSPIWSSSSICKQSTPGMERERTLSTKI